MKTETKLLEKVNCKGGELLTKLADKLTDTSDQEGQQAATEDPGDKSSSTPSITDSS